MIDVEHRALRALEHDVGLLLAQRRQRLRDVAHQRPHALGVRELLVERLLEIDRRLLEVVLQHEVVEVEDLAELGGKFLALEQVLHAHRAPRDLVFVRGTDAAAGGADGVGAARRFARLVERNVRRQDQRAVRRDAQSRKHVHAGVDERLRFTEQRFQRQHHAVADEALHVLVEDSRGNERQHGLLAADDQRVAGVVAALKTRHRGGALGEQVDDLALALVAPLGPDDDDEFAHDCP